MGGKRQGGDSFSPIKAHDEENSGVTTFCGSFRWHQVVNLPASVGDAREVGLILSGADRFPE